MNKRTSFFSSGSDQQQQPGQRKSQQQRHELARANHTERASGVVALARSSTICYVFHQKFIKEERIWMVTRVNNDDHRYN